VILFLLLAFLFLIAVLAGVVVFWIAVAYLAMRVSLALVRSVRRRRTREVSDIN